MFDYGFSVSKTVLKNSVSSTVFQAGVTNTARALDLGRTALVTNSSSGRNTSRQAIVIIVTDGMACDVTLLPAAAAAVSGQRLCSHAGVGLAAKDLAYTAQHLQGDVAGGGW